MNPPMASSFEGDRNSLYKFVVQDGNGVKGMLDLGLSQVPEAFIQPQEERIDNQSAGVCAQPPIDLSKLDGPAHQLVAEEIARAAETLGFFQVVNHGVRVELMESLKDAARAFFGQSPEKKAVYRKGMSLRPLVRYGTSFLPDKEKVLAWNDNFTMFYTNDADALEQWPEEFKELVLEYLKATTKIVRKLVEILIENLGVTLDESVVDGIVGNKAVNMNYYPGCPNPELTVGAGRHSDMGTLTVLLQDEIGGLYVKVEEDVADIAKKGEWLEIPPVPAALVVNIGDTLEILSNGRYKSAEHRVRTSTKTRVSVPFFTTPKPSVKIGPLPELVEEEVPRFREIIFGDYMNNFFNSVHDGKKALDFARAVPL